MHPVCLEGETLSIERNIVNMAGGSGTRADLTCIGNGNNTQLLNGEHRVWPTFAFESWFIYLHNKAVMLLFIH